MLAESVFFLPPHLRRLEGDAISTVLALLEEHSNSSQVKICLEACGHQVLVASDFLRAQALLGVQKVDLIISDVHLENGGSVFDFLRVVKRSERTAAIPFVLFSLNPTSVAKYLADGTRITARILGAVKYIEMDVFEPAKFQQEINALLMLEKSIPVVRLQVALEIDVPHSLENRVALVRERLID